MIHAPNLTTAFASVFVFLADAAARASVFGRGARFAARWLRRCQVFGGCGSARRSK